MWPLQCLLKMSMSLDAIRAKGEDLQFSEKYQSLREKWEEIIHWKQVHWMIGKCLAHIGCQCEIKNVTFMSAWERKRTQYVQESVALCNYWVADKGKGGNQKIWDPVCARIPATNPWPRKEEEIWIVPHYLGCARQLLSGIGWDLVCARIPATSLWLRKEEEVWIWKITCRSGIDIYVNPLLLSNQIHSIERNYITIRKWKRATSRKIRS